MASQNGVEASSASSSTRASSSAPPTTASTTPSHIQNGVEASSSSASSASTTATSLQKEVIVSWSGGKDSTMCLAALLRDKTTYKVVGLLTSITTDYDRISIHGVRRQLLEEQVASLGLPQVTIYLTPRCSNEAYEAAFHDGLSRCRASFPNAKILAFGDLYLEDVRAYREKSLIGSGYEPIFPLWGQETRLLAQRVIEEGYKATLCCVDTTQLDGQFAGRLYDHSFLADLPAKVDPCGENGEFHTFVCDGPIFHQPVNCTVGEKVLRENHRFMFCDLIPLSSSS